MRVQLGGSTVLWGPLLLLHIRSISAGYATEETILSIARQAREARAEYWTLRLVKAKAKAAKGKPRQRLIAAYLLIGDALSST